MSEVRKLNSDEIDYILSGLTEINSCIDKVAERSLESIKLSLKYMLDDIEIYSDAIESLRELIIKKFKKAKIKPGSTVGMWVAEAFGGPITQMALNTFHAAGASSKVEYGVGRMREIIFVTETPKTTSCSIYFKDPRISVNDVFIHKRRELKYLTISMLIVDIHEVLQVSDIVPPFWYDDYRMIYGDFPKSQWLMRIKLNSELLYAYNVSLSELCMMIEKSNTAICIPSPMLNLVEKERMKEDGDLEIYKANEVFIDIYPDEEGLSVSGYDLSLVAEESRGEVLLTSVIIPLLDKMQISGVPGIEVVDPVEIPVISIILNEIKLSEEKTWRLFVNKKISNGINSLDLAELCIEVDIELLDVTPDYIDLKMNNDEVPSKYLEKIIQDDEKNTISEISQLEKENGNYAFLKEPSKLKLVSTRVKAETSGTNLKKLLSLSSVDPINTKSNSIMEIYNILGLEAAKQYLLIELWTLIEYQGIYIDPQHILTLVNVMTATGGINGITYSGLFRQDGSVMKLLTVERAFEQITNTSAVGKKQSIKDITTSIIFGKKSEIGTGYNNDFLNRELMDEYEEKKRKQLEFDQNLEDDNLIISNDQNIDLYPITNEEFVIDILNPEKYGEEKGITSTINPHHFSVNVGISTTNVEKIQELPIIPMDFSDFIQTDVNSLPPLKEDTQLNINTTKDTIGEVVNKIIENNDLNQCDVSPPNFKTSKIKPLKLGGTIPKISKIVHKRKIYEIPDISETLNNLNQL